MKALKVGEGVKVGAPALANAGIKTAADWFSVSFGLRDMFRC